MESLLREMISTVGRVNPRHVRFFLVVVSLLMFLIGAGAPADHGGWGG